ncbi:MAG: ARMT1-like domain-containing protein [Erysipelotrichaceae bacterium]|nr:ARMT1-like domain-containing protein [Erysipelotrichaceae bacterium]
MNLKEKCKSCLANKQIESVADKDEKKREEYAEFVRDIIARESDKKCTPWIIGQLNDKYDELFPNERSFREYNKSFNMLVLKIENEIEERILNSEDPIMMAIKYAASGNYIDYSQSYEISGDGLLKVMDKVLDQKVDEVSLNKFKNDLDKAKKLAYLTDNCGEVVLDKVFVKVLKKLYPELDITVIVRGKEAGNDATMDDVVEIGLDKITKCIGNGTNMPGTVFESINDESKEALKNADVVIAKGLGNFEGLYGESPLNPYFIFLCKCDMFTELFGLEMFSLVFSKEEDIKTKY